jgi:phage shock protein PspC (stress-responsive transcriptional regulator)
LDKTHFILDLVLTIINLVCLGVALLHYDAPSQAGELIVVILQAVGLMFCLWSYIYCWLLMARIPGFKECCMICCGKATRDDYDDNLKKGDDSDEEKPRASMPVGEMGENEGKSSSASEDSESDHDSEPQASTSGNEKSSSSALQISESAGH